MEWRFYDDSANLVRHNLDLMNVRVDASLSKVQDTIDALSKFDTGGGEPTPSNYTIPDVVIPSAVTPTAPAAQAFSAIDPWTDPKWVDLVAEVGLDPSLVNVPGPFSPKTTLPTFTDPPTDFDDSGEPNKVTVKDVDIPGKPSWTTPTRPTFIPINPSSSPGYSEPTLEGTRPVFTGVRPSDEFLWAEPTYAARVLDDVVLQISAMLQGGTGLPAVVQQALWEKARSREEATALAATQLAFDTWAGRNFGMPPGMLVASVEDANDKNQLAANDLSRTILTEARKWEIDNLRFSVEKGIALEAMLHDWFENAVKRSFEALKYHLEIEVKLYDVAVALYNAEQAGRQTDAVIFRARIEGKLGALTAWGKELEGEIAKGQLNEQEVRRYVAEWEGVKATVSAFAEEMRGAEVHASVNRNIIEGYGAEVKAWGDVLVARKVPFEAFEIGTRGKAAQVGAYEAEARGFAETVRAAEAEGNLKVKFVDAHIAVITASTEKYKATLQAERERIQGQVELARTVLESYTADIGRYRVELEGANQARGQEIQIAEMRLRNNLAYWETTLKEFDAALARQLHRVDQVLEALKAAGQYGTALAAGAMSTVHVGAAISGAGHVTDAYGYQDNVSHKGGDRP